MVALTASPITVAAPILVMSAVVAVMFVRARKPSPTQWAHTHGTVLSATVQVGSGRTASPLVLYAYEVNGQEFRGHRVRARQGTCDASHVIQRYPAGSSVVVHYDPNDPSNSALEL